jgi:hypothetical protein
MTSNTLSLELHNEMLDIDDPFEYDESISSMNYVEATPQSQSNINTPGDITITINPQDIYLLPSESYISIKGQIKRLDNSEPYARNNEITLINNAMMYLFKQIKYNLGGKTIETIDDPGQITSMIGYLSYPDDFSTSSGLSCCWSKDTTNNASSAKYVHSGAITAADGMTPSENPNYNQGFATRKGFLFNSDPLGCFEFHIPLKHIFGFAEYKKVMFLIKHELVLSRQSDNESLYRLGAVTAGKIVLTSISWMIPEIKLPPEYEAALHKIVLENKILPLAFRARTSESTLVSQTREFNWALSQPGGIEKPRWIIIGFQTAMKNNQERNPAVFNHLNLTNIVVKINSVEFPMSGVNANFNRNEYMTLYNMFDNFKKEYFGIDSLVGGTQVNVPAFKSLFPIIVIDVRKQSEKIKLGIANMQVKFKFGDVVPADTTAYSIIISDRFYNLESNGTSLTLVSR